ncbi:MAG: iron-containing alcohol dehydrogenase [Thermomicrobiales bacterium]|jgi:hydroxyacid-oxoacid transhydrogenase|nr:iron-containing alcohol dehydrogenase [Thermomicrobiales bacterium]
MPNESAFTLDTSAIKFGPGVTREVGADLANLGLKRVLLVTDQQLRDGVAVQTALESCKTAGLEVEIFDNIRVEPTDESWAEAVEAANEGKFDSFLPVGGGSVIDTAKAANLYNCYPADLLTYVNAPIGRAEPVPGKLKPLIAVPTTAGTGSETTGVAVFDYKALNAKTAIANRALRPTMGILDPINTLTMPAMVTASSALDVLSHAIESFTAISYTSRPAPDSPKLRPSYQGSNPISDIWSSKAMEMVASTIVTVIQEPDDLEARGTMMLAAAYAGIGFGNAGVHLPHGMSYPISGKVKSYIPPGYPDDHPMVPHGMSVILTAPAVFRWTAEANPERHLEAARLLGAETGDVPLEMAGEVLSQRLIEIMKLTGMPNGLAELGFGEADLDALVAGTTPQHRVTKLSPRPASDDDLKELFRSSMTYW